MSSSANQAIPLSSDWAATATQSSVHAGPSLIQSLITVLSAPATPNQLCSLEISAVSASYIYSQFVAHIPFKLNIIPTEEQLFNIAGKNPDSVPAATAAATATASSINLFGKRSLSTPHSPSAQRRAQRSAQRSAQHSAQSQKPLEQAAHNLIDASVDPLEFVSALLTLFNLLSLVDHLKINGRHWPSPSPESLDDTSEYLPPLPSSPTFSLSIFPKTSILEIDCVPPENVLDLPSLAPTLRLLKFSRCGIFDLSAIIGDVTYPILTHFKAASCAIDELSNLNPPPPLHPPFKALAALVSLNLSGNNLLLHTTALAGLSSLCLLERLDLSFNAIMSMDSAHTLLGNVKVLILTGNRLTTAKGLDRLYSLEYLALDNNNINTTQDVVGVTRLPCLADILLQHNPFSRSAPAYRVSILNLFREQRANPADSQSTSMYELLLPALDRQAATKRELQALKDLTFESIVSVPLNHRSTDSGRPTGDALTDYSEWRYTMPAEPADLAANADSLPASACPSEDDASVSTTDTNTTPTKKKKKKKKKVAQIDDTDDDSSARDSSITSDTDTNMGFSTINTEAPSATSAAPEDEAAAARKAKRQERRSRMAKKMSELESTIGGLESSPPPPPTRPMPSGLEFEELPQSAVPEVADATEAEVAGATEAADTSVASDEFFSPEAPPPEETPPLSNPPSPVPINLEVVTEGTLTLQPTKKKKKAKKRLSLRPPPPAPSVEEAETVGDDEVSSAATVQGGRIAPRKPSLRDRPSSADAFLEEFWNAGAEAGGRGSISRSRAASENSGSAAMGEGIRDQYVGALENNSFCVAENLELYMKMQVFTSTAFNNSPAPYMRMDPPINMTVSEKFVALWEEEVIPCGKAARSLIACPRAPRRGFHGEVAQGEENASIDPQKLLLVISDSAVYFCVNDFAEDVVFSEHPRPKCLARYGLEEITRCTIGFMFQRLILGFERGGESHTFNVMTRTKIICTEVLKVLTPIANEVKSGVGLVKLKMDNDDKSWLDAFHEMGRLASGDGYTNDMDVVLYRVVRQQWKGGGRVPVMRALVLTSGRIFLVDEEFRGGGVVGRSAGEEDGGGWDGEVVFRLVDCFDLCDISEVRPADEDPTQITLVFKQKGLGFGRPHKWRLKCRDNVTAEKIVEQVRANL